MVTQGCAAPLSLSQLLEHWLDEEQSAAGQKVVEAHYFGCEHCSGALAAIAALSAGVKHLVRGGQIGAVLPPAFLHRLKQSGIRVREYRLDPGTAVLCTITPDDDLVVARLRTPLADVDRLDVRVHDAGAPAAFRLEDVPFDPAAGEILLAPRAEDLRALETAVQRVELMAVDESGERTLATYTFNHTPYRRGSS